jgi:hypothetical protein
MATTPNTAAVFTRIPEAAMALLKAKAFEHRHSVAAEARSIILDHLDAVPVHGESRGGDRDSAEAATSLASRHGRE